MSRRQTLVALAAAVAAVVLGAPRANAVSPPATTWPQDTGEVVVGIPATHSCTETLVSRYAFRNTAYGPDPNFHGVVAPPAGCPGPWAKVVLTMGVEVSGTQFDRTGDVRIGGVEVLRTSTEEPPLTGTVTWSVRKDITQYSALLKTAQPVEFVIGNVVTTVYNGVYYGTLSLTYYSSDATHGAGAAPDAVIGGTQTYISTPAAHVDLATALPQNLVGLQGELFADGHGACDEFWWTEVPGASSCGGAPYREVAVRVDGKLAGIAPVFPDVFTGADGPDYWHPIPAPRAFDLRPYTVDLTPFVGMLTDGLQHTFSVSVLDWTGHSGDNWFVGINLLGSLNHASSTRTTGSITADNAPAASTDVVNSGPVSAVETVFSASHVLSIAGVESIPGIGSRTVAVNESLHGSSKQTVPVNDSWNWTNRTTTTPAGGAATTHTLSATYSISFDLVHFAFVDAYTDILAVPGAPAAWTKLDDRMQTTSEFPGIVGQGGVSWESWKFSDSRGACTNHELSAALQEFLVDSVSRTGCNISLPVPT